MPIYLRNFYVRELLDVKKKEKEQVDTIKSDSKISKPNISPSRFNT